MNNNFNNNWNNNNGWGNNGYVNPNPYAQPVQQAPMAQPMVPVNQNVMQPQPGMVQQPVQQQVQQPQLPPFNFKTDPQDEMFFTRILTAILTNGISKAKDGVSNTKGYACTFKGSNFSLTINLVFNTVYKHLQPYVYNGNTTNLNMPHGENIDDVFLKQAAFLTPQLSSIRDNYGRTRVADGRTIVEYMDKLSQYIDAVGDYVDKFIIKNPNGSFAIDPRFQSILTYSFRFGGINVTPNIKWEERIIADQYGRQFKQNQPVIGFLYSLSEDVTLTIKQDQAFME